MQKISVNFHFWQIILLYCPTILIGRDGDKSTGSRVDLKVMKIAALFFAVVMLTGASSVSQMQMVYADHVGCSPGFWKNNTGAWPIASPGPIFDTTFGVNFFTTIPDKNLLQALQTGGGGNAPLARLGTALYLEALAHGEPTAPIVALVAAGNLAELEVLLI